METSRSDTTAMFAVPGASCGHCRAAISEQVATVPGIEGVEVDLDTKLRGEGFDADAVVAAIEEAGYEVA